MTIKTGLSEGELAEYKKKVLGEHRGRKQKVPYETGELRKLQKKEAAHAFVRLSHAAQSVALRKQSFGVWQDLNRWIYEIYHGRPKIAMEGEVKVPIRVSFEVVGQPKELPSAFKQVEEGTHVTGDGHKSTDFTNTDDAD